MIHDVIYLLLILIEKLFFSKQLQGFIISLKALHYQFSL